MSIFIIGFVVGIIVTNLVLVFVLGLCRAAARTDEQLDLLEEQARQKHKIIGGP